MILVKKTITILLTWAIMWEASIVSGQPFEKKTILTKYSKGNVILELINDSDIVALKKELKNTPNLDKFLTIIGNKSHKAAGIDMTPSIYFDPRDKVFVFTIAAGKFIKDGTYWGLFDYLFVLEFRINSKVGDDTVISQIILLENDTKLKSWWLSFMQSYNYKGFLRDEWADKFGLVPPPPLPPKKSDWLKG